MVTQQHLRRFGIFWLGSVTLVATMGFTGGQYTAYEAAAPRQPIPYAFDPDPTMTGLIEPGVYQLYGELTIIDECERHPVPEGFGVNVAIPGRDFKVPARWYDGEGRPRNEDRVAGTDTLHIIAELPEFYEWAEFYTMHTCPVIGQEGAITVRQQLHYIPGNIVEQKALSGIDAQTIIEDAEAASK